MAKITTKNLVELIKRSGLVEDAQAAQVLEPLKARHGGQLPDDANVVAEAFIQAGLVTRWHCDKLLDGKYKGFFLSKYKLLGHLGTGGMSSVYLAEHRVMHRRVAVKVLPKNRVEDSSYLARFHLEAKAAAALDHRNIVRAYDVDNEGDTHFIVMEYVEGKDLQSIVKQSGPLDFDLAANYTLQAAEGLQHAHEAGLIHRDVKPANLLVDEKGVVKILDMGLALFADDNKASLTVEHNENVLGTADYLSPEQALNSHKVDARADVYSLGCTLYFTLTGHAPFPEGTLAQRIAKHQSAMPAPIAIDRPDCPAELAAMCMKMMNKKPAHRYASAKDVADAISGWLGDRGQLLERDAALSSKALAVGAGMASGASRIGGSSAARLPQSPAARVGDGSGSRPVVRPPATSDTASDRGHATVKGLPAEAPDGESGRGRGSGRHKALPIAKSLDPTPAKRSDSGDIGLGAEVAAALQNLPIEEPKSVLDERLGRYRQKAPVPLWVWIAGGAAAVVVVLVVILGVVLGGGRGGTPAPKPKKGFRDTSSIQVEETRQVASLAGNKGLRPEA
jgi:tRNA A-37 threonylcarbamoyl transferase component Bud32